MNDMGFLVLFMMMLVLFAFLFVIFGVKVVQQAETIVVERLGQYHATLGSGINIIVPLIDRPRSIDWKYNVTDAQGRQITIRKTINKIDLRETVYDFPHQNVITRDNVSIEISAIIYYQIVNAKNVVYEIANLPDAIEKLTQTSLRNIIGEMDLDETLTSRDKVNDRLREILDLATEKWGVKVNRVELQDILPPRDIKEAMEKQMRAERDRRAAVTVAEAEKKAAILQSEGRKESQINTAEGEKQSNILRAEGEAQARIKLAEAEATAIKLIAQTIEAAKGDPVQYLIAMRYMEAWKEAIAGKDAKVIMMPYEATGVLSSLGGIKEMLAPK
jgi:regulator of protease activity HflC (stomatin/prohibitin superfamily)